MMKVSNVVSICSNVQFLPCHSTTLTYSRTDQPSSVTSRLQSPNDRCSPRTREKRLFAEESDSSLSGFILSKDIRKRLSCKFQDIASSCSLTKYQYGVQSQLAKTTGDENNIDVPRMSLRMSQGCQRYRMASMSCLTYQRSHPASEP